MLKLSSIRHHHIAIAALCSLVLVSIYQSVYPLPEAKANTVTIVIDTQSTNSGREIPCGSVGTENDDCGIGDLNLYLDSYLSAPANTTNKQFRIVPGSTVQQINLDRTITIALPRACSNCSIEFDGITSSNQKLDIISTANSSGIKPATGFLLNDNTTPVTIKNSHFQGFTDSALKTNGVSNATVSISANSFGTLSSTEAANAKAITVTNTRNTVIDENTFGGHTGNAIDLVGSTTQNTRISDNLFGVSSSTSLSSSLPAISGSAVSIESASNTTIENNIFANSTENGVKISSGSNNTINGTNRFFNNGEKAINVLSGGNNAIGAPAIVTAQKQNNTLLVKGSGSSGATVNFYRANNSSAPLVVPDMLGGEGYLFLGSAVIDSPNDRNIQVGQYEFALSVSIELGQIISSFQTLSGNSSMFGNNVTITAVPVSTPTPTPTQTPTPTPTATPTQTPTSTPTPAPTLNRLPTANAGSDQSATLSALIRLHGEGSIDPDGDNLSFQWAQHTSDRYRVTLSNATGSMPTFTTPSSITELQTDLHFSLEVNDNRGGISRDEVVVHVSRERQRPVASLVIQPASRVAPGTEIILDGSNSTFDSGSINKQYRFRQINTTQIGVTIDQDSSSTPQARVLIPASLNRTTPFTFSLEVSDGTLTSDSVSASVEVAPQSDSDELCTNELPDADAGRNQIISRPVGTIVVLNGNNSSDPNNTQLTYSWRQLSGGPKVDLRNTDTSIVNFTIPEIATTDTNLNFALTVTNRCGKSSTNTTKVTIKNSDLDGDGLSNDREEELRTDPNIADTDGDGLKDGEEVKNFCLNPLATDSENDGIKDGDEDINHNSITDGGETNPCLYDTDGDGLPDGFERLHQLNPLNPQDAKEDADSDNLTNIEEFIYKTDPRNKDTDKDALFDGVEVKGLNRTNPIKDDTDNDGVLDGNEDKNHNGTTEGGETSPVRFDSDFDGLSDGLEIGLGNTQAKSTDLTKYIPDLDPVSKTSPLTPDTDGDGVLDGNEDKNHNGGFDCGETNPLDTQNTIKPCTTASPTPVVNKNARSTDSNSIKVQKPVVTPTPTSTGLVQLISPLNNFSISVQKGTPSDGLNISLPQIKLSPSASIFVLPGIVTNTIPSIFVLGSKL